MLTQRVVAMLILSGGLHSSCSCFRVMDIITLVLRGPSHMPSFPRGTRSGRSLTTKRVGTDGAVANAARDRGSEVAP